MSERRPRILCISLSPLRNDARVLRQIGMLASVGDVTTVGFGEAPGGVASHHRVPDGLSTLPQTPMGVLRLALRLHRSAELTAPAVRWAHERLAGERFDLVVANEARVLGLAHRLAHNAPVWADMHEWAPEERTHILSWRLLVAPFMTHLCAHYLPLCAMITTVGDAIANLYRARFGVAVDLMRNVGPRRELSEGVVDDDHIRLVHSGAAIHGRRLDLMIETMSLLDNRFTLDLYLMPGGDHGNHLRELQELASHDLRIRFHDPVAPDALPSTLNAYDVGVFWIPPTHTNARFTLPNKFFDFVQARLMIAVGPSPEMVALVNEYQLGVVSDDFTAAACAASLRSLDARTIRRAKHAANIAARTLNFEAEADRILGRLRGLLFTGGRSVDVRTETM